MQHLTYDESRLLPRACIRPCLPVHSYSPRCWSHPGSLCLFFLVLQQGKPIFAIRLLLSVPLTSMCFSGSWKATFYYSGLELFLFTQPKVSPHQTLSLHSVLSQFLSETDLLFFLLTYLLPRSLKGIYMVAALLNSKSSLHGTSSRNSHLLSTGLLNERMIEFNSYSHTVKEVLYFRPSYECTVR